MAFEIQEFDKTDSEYIFFIVLFHVDLDTLDDTKAKGLYNRKYCCGYYREYAQAEKAILYNWGDLYEDGYYNLVLIEARGEGLITVPLEKWFKVVPVYNEDREKEFAEVGFCAVATCTEESGPIRSKGWKVKEYKISEVPRPKRFGFFSGFALA